MKLAMMIHPRPHILMAFLNSISSYIYCVYLIIYFLTSHNEQLMIKNLNNLLGKICLG